MICFRIVSHLYFLIASSAARQRTLEPSKTLEASDENDGSDTIDIVDRTLLGPPSTLIASVTKPRDIQLIDGIAQSAGAEFSQLSSAVQSQSQSVESELESFVNFFIE